MLVYTLRITNRGNKRITNRGRFQGLQIESRGITNRSSLRDFKSGQKDYKSGQRDYKPGLGFQIVQGFNPSLLRLQLTFLALFSTNKLPLFLRFWLFSSCWTFPYWCLDLLPFFRIFILRFSILSYLLVGLSLKMFCGKPLLLPDS